MSSLTSGYYFYMPKNPKCKCFTGSCRVCFWAFSMSVCWNQAAWKYRRRKEKEESEREHTQLLFFGFSVQLREKVRVSECIILGLTVYSVAVSCNFAFHKLLKFTIFVQCIVKSVISLPLYHTMWEAIECSTACSGVFMYHGVSQA